MFLKILIGIMLFMLFCNFIVELHYIIKLRKVKTGEKFHFTNEEEGNPFTYINPYNIEATVIDKTFYTVTYNIKGKTYTSSFRNFIEQDYSKF